MKHLVFSSYLLLLFIGFVLCGCGGEAKIKQPDIKAAIQGDWLLKKAFRDKRETVALENTFFHIKNGGELNTNFNMDMEPKTFDFELENNIIRQQSDPPLTYHIYEVSDTSLTLQTRYLGYEFKLVLEKQATDSPH